MIPHTVCLVGRPSAMRFMATHLQGNEEGKGGPDAERNQVAGDVGSDGDGRGDGMKRSLAERAKSLKVEFRVSRTSPPFEINACNVAKS